MQVYNKEIRCHRNETFTLDWLLVNNDLSPYILSSELRDPYLLLTVADTRYNQTDRYIKNSWLTLMYDTDIRFFYNTNPVSLNNMYTSAAATTLQYPNGFDDLEGESTLPSGWLKTETDVVYFTTQSSQGGHGLEEAVYSFTNSDGITEYKIPKWQSTSGTYTYVNYRLHIAKLFTNQDTSEWNEGAYVYSLTLVDGIGTRQYLVNLATNRIEFTDQTSNQELYDKLKALHDEDVDKQLSIVNLDRPLTIIDVSIPIIKPTKLTVVSDIQGGVKWQN